MTSKKNRDEASNWDMSKLDRVQLGSRGTHRVCRRSGRSDRGGDIISVQDPVGGRRLFHILHGYELQLAE